LLTFFLSYNRKASGRSREDHRPQHHGPLLVDLTLAGFNLAEAMRTNPCLELAFERDMANWQSPTQCWHGCSGVETSSTHEKY